MKVYTVLNIINRKTNNWTVIGDFIDLEGAKKFIEVPNDTWSWFNIHQRFYEIGILERDTEDNRLKLAFKSVFTRVGFGVNMPEIGDSGYIWSINEITYT